MTIKELQEVLKEKGLNNIEFEDNNGNTLFWLKDLGLADSETNETGHHIRLQLETEKNGLNSLSNSF